MDQLLQQSPFDYYELLPEDVVPLALRGLSESDLRRFPRAQTAGAEERAYRAMAVLRSQHSETNRALFKDGPLPIGANLIPWQHADIEFSNLEKLSFEVYYYMVQIVAFLTNTTPEFVRKRYSKVHELFDLTVDEPTSLADSSEMDVRERVQKVFQDRWNMKSIFNVDEEMDGLGIAGEILEVSHYAFDGTSSLSVTVGDETKAVAAAALYRAAPLFPHSVRRVVVKPVGNALTTDQRTPENATLSENFGIALSSVEPHAVVVAVPNSNASPSLHLGGLRFGSRPAFSVNLLTLSVARPPLGFDAMLSSDKTIVDGVDRYVVHHASTSMWTFAGEVRFESLEISTNTLAAVGNPDRFIPISTTPSAHAGSWSAANSLSFNNVVCSCVFFPSPQDLEGVLAGRLVDVESVLVLSQCALSISPPPSDTMCGLIDAVRSHKLLRVSSPVLRNTLSSVNFLIAWMCYRQNKPLDSSGTTVGCLDISFNNDPTALELLAFEIDIHEKWISSFGSLQTAGMVTRPFKAIAKIVVRDLPPSQNSLARTLNRLSHSLHQTSVVIVPPSH